MSHSRIRRKQKSFHCDKLLEMAMDNNLEQVIQKPTRRNNTLDLLFSNNPTLIENVQYMTPLTPLADHRIIYVET